jgi:hypothetical protein
MAPAGKKGGGKAPPARRRVDQARVPPRCASRILAAARSVPCRTCAGAPSGAGTLSDPARPCRRPGPQSLESCLWMLAEHTGVLYFAARQAGQAPCSMRAGFGGGAQGSALDRPHSAHRTVPHVRLRAAHMGGRVTPPAMGRALGLSGAKDRRSSVRKRATREACHRSPTPAPPPRDQDAFAC